MKKFFLILLILVGFYQLNSQIDTSKWQTYDKMLDSCINGELANAQCFQCMLQVLDLWEKEMNKNYDYLLSISVGIRNKKYIKNSQKKWLEYYNSEAEYLDYYYTEFKQGTMYYGATAYRRIVLLKERTKFLNMYILNFND